MRGMEGERRAQHLLCRSRPSLWISGAFTENRAGSLCRNTPGPGRQAWTSHGKRLPRGYTDAESGLEESLPQCRAGGKGRLRCAVWVLGQRGRQQGWVSERRGRRGGGTWQEGGTWAAPWGRRRASPRGWGPQSTEAERNRVWGCSEEWDVSAGHTQQRDHKGMSR